MTKIKILNRNHMIVGFECSGHTGYAEEGSDIVCSAVSAITLTACLGIVEVCKIDAFIDKNDNKGYLKLLIATNVEAEKLAKAQIVFETMFKGLQEIENDFKKYIKLEANYEIF
ncbi:MAG: ribosomal-processing cysteine protease Prp [Clostridia bacterium]